MSSHHVAITKNHPTAHDSTSHRVYIFLISTWFNLIVKCLVEYFHVNYMENSLEPWKILESATVSEDALTWMVTSAVSSDAHMAAIFLQPPHGGHSIQISPQTLKPHRF